MKKAKELLYLVSVNKVILIIIAVAIIGVAFFKNSLTKPASQNSSAQPSTDNQPAVSEKNQTADSSVANSTVTNEVKGASTMIIDVNKSYQAILSTTEGDITIDLNVKTTPITANNFVSLAKKNFYDNTIFHRVIKGFMIQGGDPKGDGTGGPGYKFDDEPFQGEYTRGTVAMANAGPNTNGSQFFIMHQDYALPKNYVIFGKVTQGLDVVDKIAEAPTQSSASGEDSKPVAPVTVKSVRIIEK